MDKLLFQFSLELDSPKIFVDLLDIVKKSIIMKPAISAKQPRKSLE